MTASQHLLKILVFLTLLPGLIGPALLLSGSSRLPAEPAAQSYLVQVAARDPGKVVSVIVQKADQSGSAEKLAEQLGGEIIDELESINAFVVELPAGKALELAASATVRGVSLNAALEKAGEDALQMIG